MKKLDKTEWVYDSGPLEVALQDWNVAFEGTNEIKSENLTFHFQPDKMLAEFTGDRRFVLYGDEGQNLVTVHLDTGDVEFGENYTPGEAARVFWETIGKFDKKEDVDVDVAWAEYEKTLKTSTQVLHEVRESLGVPEGSDILEAIDDFKKLEMMDFTTPSRKELAQGKGSKVEKLPVPAFDTSWDGQSTPGVMEDVQYFKDKLERAKEKNLPTARIEKQLELLEDSILIYHEKRPSEVDIQEKVSVSEDGKMSWRALTKEEIAFNDAMKVID